MKWTGMYLLGFVILVGGLLAALWKLGILATIGTTWTVIGVVIALGIGIMISVASSGTRKASKSTVGETHLAYRDALARPTCPVEYVVARWPFRQRRHHEVK